MSDIVLIASGESMASCGEQLKNSLPHPQRLLIVNARMENAVSYARHRLPRNADVIIARGNTARLLKEARLPVPVVTIPITDRELIRTIEKARDIYGAEDSSIAYIGIEDTVRSVSAFLKTLHPSIRLYSVHSSEDIRSSIRRAVSEQVNVVIGGVYTRQVAEEAGLSCVVLETSFSSVREAYERALEVQKAVLQQKRRLQEHLTVIESISDGIVSISEKGIITLANPSAEAFFRVPEGKLAGQPCSAILPSEEQALVNRTLLSGSPVPRHISRLMGEDCLLELRPILVGKRPRGVILTVCRPSSLPEDPSLTEAGRENLPCPAAGADPSPVSLSQLTGRDPAFSLARSAAELCVASSLPVLLIGQSGTGRRTLARCIHRESSRSGQLFLTADASLLRTDDFLSAHRGSLYIREITGLPPLMSVRLEEYLRTGLLPLEDGRRAAPDVRILAGTSRPLKGILPDSLVCLLETLTLSLPSLEARISDVPLLADSFLNRFGGGSGRTCSLTGEASALLLSLSWPGNLHQLESLCQKLVLFAPEDGIITPSLIRRLADTDAPYGVLDGRPPLPPEQTVLLRGRPVTLQELRSLEERCHGRKTLMARQLGVSRSTLWRCLRELEESRGASETSGNGEP